MKRDKTAQILRMLLAGALACLLGAGCGAPAQRDNGKLKVVATTSIIGQWVRIIGGDQVEVKTLVGPDGDPHEFEPAPADSIAISEANLIFANGLGLETWLDKLCQSADTRASRVIVTRGIIPRHAARNANASSDAGEDLDPHAWQSVANAITMVGNIRDALIEADPAHASDERARADVYLQQLAALDTWVHQQIISIPSARRKLVTSHDAFGYFGQRYGLDISRSALESVTTEAADPSARQIAEIIDQIKASGIPVIFLENIESPKLISQIASDAGVQVGPPLYTDALGKPGSAGDTYIKMMRYNVNTLVKALSQ